MRYTRSKNPSDSPPLPALTQFEKSKNAFAFFSSLTSDEVRQVEESFGFSFSFSSDKVREVEERFRVLLLFQL